MSQVNRKEARFLTVLWHLNLGVACPCAIFTAAKTGRLQCKAPTGSPACHLRRPREGRGGLSDTVIKPGSCVGDTEKHFGGARGKIRGCLLAVCLFFLAAYKAAPHIFLVVLVGDQSSGTLANT